MQKLGSAMPLSLFRAGETVTVCRVRGNEDMKRHLQEIGFVDGAEVHVVSSSASNVIVLSKGCAVRLGFQSRAAHHGRLGKAAHPLRRPLRCGAGTLISVGMVRMRVGA